MRVISFLRAAISCSPGRVLANLSLDCLHCSLPHLCSIRPPGPLPIVPYGGRICCPQFFLAHTSQPFGLVCRQQSPRVADPDHGPTELGSGYNSWR
jgi:hypothetical protein